MRCGAAPRDHSNTGRLFFIGASVQCHGVILLCNINVKYNSTCPPLPGFAGTPHFKRGSVMDVDFRENLANGEPMSRGGQLPSETEAELFGDEGVLRPVPGLGA